MTAPRVHPTVPSQLHLWHSLNGSLRLLRGLWGEFGTPNSYRSIINEQLETARIAADLADFNMFGQIRMKLAELIAETLQKLKNELTKLKAGVMKLRAAEPRFKFVCEFLYEMKGSEDRVAELEPAGNQGSSLFSAWRKRRLKSTQGFDRNSDVQLDEL